MAGCMFSDCEGTAQRVFWIWTCFFFTVQFMNIYLGNTLDSGVKNKDFRTKRGITIIGKLSGILQEFYFAYRSSKCSIMYKYCTSLYSCELWDLFWEDFFRLFISWNICVCKVRGLPGSTHWLFIAPLSGLKHIRTLIYKRFLCFFRKYLNHNNNILYQVWLQWYI